MLKIKINIKNKRMRKKVKQTAIPKFKIHP